MARPSWQSATDQQLQCAQVRDHALNAGCLKPLEVIVPPGCMLNPNPPVAVVAGNVETSMCVTHALYGALGVMAAGRRRAAGFALSLDPSQHAGQSAPSVSTLGARLSDRPRDTSS